MTDIPEPKEGDEPSVVERHRLEKWLELALIPELLSFAVDDVVDDAMQNGDGFSPVGFTKRDLRLVPEWETLNSISEQYERDTRQPFEEHTNPVAICRRQLSILRMVAVDAAREVFRTTEQAEAFLSAFHDQFLSRTLGPFLASLPRQYAAFTERYTNRERLLKSRPTLARKTKKFWADVWNRDPNHWPDESFGIPLETIIALLGYLVDRDVTTHSSVAIPILDSGSNFSISRLYDLTDNDTFDKL